MTIEGREMRRKSISVLMSKNSALVMQKET